MASNPKKKPPPLARNQLFFVGWPPNATAPMLVALTIQREPLESGRALLEAKAFMSRQGRWQSPFYQQVELDQWPGPGLTEALEAYQGSGAALRLTLEDPGDVVSLSMRSKSSRLQLESEGLSAVSADSDTATDPHGSLSWRAGLARLLAAGESVSGLLLVEQLDKPQVRLPGFGRYEMWLLAPTDGSLVLGRCKLGTPGQAVRVSPSGEAQQERFTVYVLTSREDTKSDYALPSVWRISYGNSVLELQRRDGSLGRGRGPKGQPAVYDISLATQTEGKASALVFHLQDQPAAQ